MSDSLPSKNEFHEQAVAYRITDAAFELPSSREHFSPPVLNPTEYAAWCSEMQRSLGLPQDDPVRRLASKTSEQFVI